MTRADAEAYVLKQITYQCVQIEDIFKKDCSRYVTVIVRPPGKPEQEVVVTNDPDAGAIIETIRRRFNLSAPPETPPAVAVPKEPK